VVDGVAVVAAAWLFTPLVQRLSTPAGTNALLVSTVFILFCFAVYAVRKLHPAAGESSSEADGLLSSRVRGVLAFFCGLVMTAVIAHQLGYFASIQVTGIGDINEGGVAAFYSFAPGAWLGFAMLYILVLAFPVRPTISFPSTKYTAAALFALLGQQLMLLVMAAEMAAVFTTLPWVVGAFLLVGLLLLLFLPPRLLLATRMSLARSPLLMSSLLTLLLPIIYCTAQFIVQSGG
jgi:hypothetical protein